MADDEQFSLCWNNFNSNLSAGFHESLCRGDLVDVTLAAEGQLVKAHRLVLSVCSPYFRKMFTQMPANQHAFVFLKDVSHSALKDLIQFMYCGEVNVKQEALPAFISTAEALQIKGLTDSDPSPSGQPPSEPTTPTPQMPQVQTSPRLRQQRTVAATRSYKIETVDETSNDSKPQTTQIVIQTTAAQVSQPTAITITQPTATIQHHHHQHQQQQHHHHMQTQHHHQQQQQLQSQSHQISTVSIPSGTVSTVANAATHVVGSSHKRPAQRSSLGSVTHMKRSKTSTIDPLEGAEANGGGGVGAATQQITIQTAIVSDTKTQQQQQNEAAEYIDLPLELPTKSEPDYTDETGEVDPNEQDATYVEDESYGDIRYDESYFAENEDGGGGGGVATTGATTTAVGNINVNNTTNAGNVTVGIGSAASGGGGVVGSAAATTSKAIIKQQQNTSFSDSSYADGTDQTNNDAQDIDNDNYGRTLLEAQAVARKRGRPKKLIKDIATPISVKAKIEEAVSKNEGQPAIYASTTKGTVKLLYDGHHFRYSFRKGKYSIFQCCYKENKEECKVRVITDHKLVYPLDGEHVHYVHATDKSVTSIKFTPGAEVTDVTVEKGHVIASGKEIINNDNDNEQHEQELQIVSLDEHFPEFAETIDTKSINHDETKQQNETKTSIESKKVIESSNTKITSIATALTPATTTSVESTVITTAVFSEMQREQPIEDPNDFREKIKKRLQKALLGKKKQ